VEIINNVRPSYPQYVVEENLSSEEIPNKKVLVTPKPAYHYTLHGFTTHKLRLSSQLRCIEDGNSIKTVRTLAESPLWCSG
jgi:hypothetical protein